jgi:uncharacterized protein
MVVAAHAATHLYEDGSVVAFGGQHSFRAWPQNHRLGQSRLRICFVTIAQLGVAIYIGYYGAGVGFLLLPILALMGIENMHAMNGLRVLLATVGNAVAVVLFIAARAVIWPQALLVMVGAILGGYAGAHYAQKLKPATVRSIVISIGVAMTAYFFWKTRGM